VTTEPRGAPAGTLIVRGRCLVLDDDHFALAMADACLRELAFEDVVLCETVVSALHKLDPACPPSLILCDLNIPEQDGIEFLRELGGRFSETPIIIVSGLEEPLREAAERIAAGYGLRVLGTVQKPLEVAQLERLLASEVPAGAVSPHSAPPVLTRQEVKTAIETELTLHLQPQVRVRDGSVCGAEALLRLNGRWSGLPIRDFVDTVELYDLSPQLTEAMLNRVLDELAAHPATWLERVVSLNISAQDLRDVSFPDRVSLALARRGVAPESMTLELTESCNVADLTRSIDVLTRLRMKGFCLSLDDFGTGYASLDKLTYLPFKEVKLDRSLLLDARSHRNSSIVLESVVAMASKLGLTVVAEGVETADDLARVREVGCHLAQGYLFSPPVPVDAFRQLPPRYDT